MKALDIWKFIEGISPGPGADEGVRFGDPEAEVKGVLVAWMATTKAIERAAAEGCNLMIVHESLLLPYSADESDWSRFLHWTANRKRLELLAKHGITVIRAHGMLDRLCVLDDFARALGLPEPTVKEGYVRIYDIPETTVRALAEEVKRKVNLPFLRVVGDLEKPVRRVGLPWGGLGLTVNIAFIETLLSHQPDVLIAGESDEYAMRYVEDAGVALIETAHSTSENFGLRNFCQRLKEEFPGLKVVFFDLGPPWWTV